MTDDLDAVLTTLLASPESVDADADAFAEKVLRRLERRDTFRMLVLGAAGAAGLGVFAWQIVARFDALGAALQALLGGVLQSVEAGYTVLFAVLLMSTLAGGSTRHGRAG